MSKALASLDIGTNSTLFLVAEVTEDGSVLPRFHDVKTNDLGRGLNAEGYLSPETIDLNIEILRSFRNISDQYGAVEIRIAATEALRRAKNAEDLIQSAAKELGLQINIISGKQEAFLTYHGIRSGLPEPNSEIIAVDVGGGSSEIIHGKGENILYSDSMPIGAVALHKQHIRHDPPTASELMEVRNASRKALAQLPTELLKTDCDLVICGGTASSLAAADLKLPEYNPEKIGGRLITKEKVERFIHQFASCTLEERREIAGVGRKRAEIILPGTIIIAEMLIRLQRKRYITSERGLRYGLLANSGKDNNFA
ncbi:hypothetical protein KJ564_11505 [bacterium]|nr:hypothetical protein [bacterium]